MKNSDLSLTALAYNAHINAISHKAGMSKYKSDISSLLNKCFTDATIIAASSKEATLENGSKVNEYAVKLPADASHLQTMINAPVKVYFNAAAREQEQVFAIASRDVVNAKDSIGGKAPQLLTPDEYAAACDTLEKGQFPLTLTPVTVSKEREAYVKSVEVVQFVQGQKVRAFQTSSDEPTYKTVLCKAMFYKASGDVSIFLGEVFEYPISTVFTLVTGRDEANSVSGTNPFAKFREIDKTVDEA